MVERLGPAPVPPRALRARKVSSPIERSLQGRCGRHFCSSIFVALWAPAPAMAACPATIANQISAADGTQLVTVVVPRRTSTLGELRLWKKSGECWVAVTEPWAAWVGGRGVSPNKREGDRRTPAGLFGFGRTMYGVAPNPGVRYRYHRVVCGDWWVEDPRSRWYNQFRHVRCGTKPPFTVVSDDMSRSPTAYRHLAVIDYNMSPDRARSRLGDLPARQHRSPHARLRQPSAPAAPQDSALAAAVEPADDRDRHSRRSAGAVARYQDLTQA